MTPVLQLRIRQVGLTPPDQSFLVTDITFQVICLQLAIGERPVCQPVAQSCV
jgi:hypothetical protein